MTEKPYIAGIDIGYVKGELNGVTLKVRTKLGDGPHVFRYGVSSTAREPTVDRQEHKHPWGERVKSDPEVYAEDAKKARETARDELKKRNLDDVSEWHQTDFGR